MIFYEPTRCRVDPVTGVLGNATGRYQKRFADLAGLYADADAYAAMTSALGDTVVYDVHEFRPTEAAGDLIFGVTRMSPGKVGREFFMTRGHIHRIADRPEIYYGQQGSGVMLLESPAGDIRIVEIEPQAICYVPPFWIHRSVNTGTTDFVMVFSYPADAGQDYDIIARSGGMRSRIVDDGRGGWAEEANPFYRPRDPATGTTL